MQIEATIKEYLIGDKKQYKIDLGNNKFLSAQYVGFKYPKLEFSEIDKDSFVLGKTVFFDSIEDSEFVVREYFKSKNAKNTKITVFLPSKI